MAVFACTDIPYFRLRDVRLLIFLKKFFQHCKSFTRESSVVLEILNIVVQEGKTVHSLLPPVMTKGRVK